MKMVVRDVTCTIDFVVKFKPVISTLSPQLALSGGVITNAHVTGSALNNASFAFMPSLYPPLIDVAVVDSSPAGVTATLYLTISNEALGLFALVATNTNDSSDTFVTNNNSLQVLVPDEDLDNDGLSNLQELTLYSVDPFDSDTDDDSYIDGIEIAAGSDPLDLLGTPFNAGVPGEFASPIFSIINFSDPFAPDLPGEVASAVISIVNYDDPSVPDLPGEAMCQWSQKTITHLLHTVPAHVDWPPHSGR